MLLIAEGVDCGGKTTAVNRIQAYYRDWCDVNGHQPDILAMRKSQPEEDRHILEQYELDLEREDVLEKVLSPTALVVSDRWATGELIYGPIYRGRSLVSKAMNLHIEMFLDAIGAIKLIAQPANVSTVHERYEKRGDDFLKREHIDQVHRAYEDHAQHHRYLRYASFDRRLLIEMAHQRTTEVIGTDDSLATLPTYVGHHRPQILFVGDQRNDGPRGDLRYKRAFTPWQSGGSALYLMNTIFHAGFWRTYRLGIVNGHEAGPNLNMVNNLDEPPAVVALGSNASAALMAAGVEHERVPHPQWWRRFRYDKMEAYGATIRNAMGVV